MPPYNTLRPQDYKSEKAVAEFLDRHFYPQYFESTEIKNDKQGQYDGIDLIGIMGVRRC
jgi:hypothetical protein